jgi:vacuolar protein sorting-associated protein 13A/C
MAKALLLNVLVNVLGDYVEGLTEENLKVGVWSGKIVLKKLQLNRASLHKLKLPVDVINGFVDELEVNIPWTSLESNPVKILINGVYLLVAPLDVSNIDPLEAYQRTRLARQGKLVQAEKAVELAAMMLESDDENKSLSYVQRLTTNIIDNLEINLRNIHIRYEDKQSIPGSLFSFGITLESFVVSTTNSNWEEMFVARDGKKDSVVHKLSKLSNLLIYWNTKESELSKLEFNEWMNAMQSRIYSLVNNNYNTKVMNNMEYILSPPNLLVLKIVHNDNENAIPKLSTSIESMGLKLNIDKIQYQQAMMTLSTFSMLEKKQIILQYRPMHRPNQKLHGNVKLWWQYALRLVTNNPDVLLNKVS